MFTRRTAVYVALAALAVPVGFAAGLGARPLLDQLNSPSYATQPSLAWATPTELQIFSPPTQAQRPAALSAVAQSSARLESSLVIGGMVQAPATHSVALEDGTGFQVRIASDRAGWVELYAVNPWGVQSAQALWSGWVDAGGVLTTPMLRLTGTRGIEHLQVVLRGQDNRALGQQNFRILHV